MRWRGTRTVPLTDGGKIASAVREAGNLSATAFEAIRQAPLKGVHVATLEVGSLLQQVDGSWKIVERHRLGGSHAGQHVQRVRLGGIHRPGAVGPARP